MSGQTKQPDSASEASASDDAASPHSRREHLLAALGGRDAPLRPSGAKSYKGRLAALRKALDEHPDGEALRAEHHLPARRRGEALQQKPLALKLAAVLWFSNWSAGVAMGMIIGVWRPGVGVGSTGAQAQVVTLLLASLVTFSCAMIASIELFKLTRGGRSVALTLAPINAGLVLLLMFYGQNWVGAAAQVMFAVAVIAMCTGRTTLPRLSAGVALALLAALVQVGAAVAYERVLSAADADRRAESYDQAADKWEAALVLSQVVGEGPKVRAALMLHAGYSIAQAGDPERGYELIDRSFRLDLSDDVYWVRAKVHCLRVGLEYRPYREQALTEEQIGRFERARVWRGPAGGSDSDEDIFDLLPD